MSKYDKKLLLVLIALIVILILTLTIKPSKRPSDFVQRYKNKKLVADAIIAFNEDPYAPNMPVQYDPNFVQYRLHSQKPASSTPSFYLPNGSCDMLSGTFINTIIMAEYSMVAVFRYDAVTDSSQGTSRYMEFSLYRIANDKIVECWSAPAIYSVDVSQ